MATGLATRRARDFVDRPS